MGRHRGEGAPLPTASTLGRAWSAPVPYTVDPGRAEQTRPRGVKVVRTVARSTLTPLNHARSTVCGSTAYGTGAEESGGLRWVAKVDSQTASVPYPEPNREASMYALRPLVVFFAYVLTLAVVVLFLASGVLAVSHRGLSVELFQALALLVLCLALLMACNRFLTGQWHRWSRVKTAPPR